MENRIGIVLPLAPYKWNITVKDDSVKIKSFFLEFSKRKLNIKDKDKAIIENANTRCCFTCMIALMKSLDLKYEAKYIGDHDILEYASNHSISKPSSSCLTVYRNQISFIMKGSTKFFECSEITSGNDILPINEVNTKVIKEEWTLNDFITGDEVMVSVDEESKEDVQNYNELHTKYLDSKKALSKENEQKLQV